MLRLIKKIDKTIMEWVGAQIGKFQRGKHPPPPHRLLKKIKIAILSIIYNGGYNKRMMFQIP
jgi:hypothetical protein